MADSQIIRLRRTADFRTNLSSLQNIEEDLTLFSHGAMVDGLQFDDEHSEAVGESTTDDGDDEDSEANEPALAVRSQRRLQFLPLGP